ncbi:hypothetical protein SCA04_18390 [Staphylococcus carnosus]|nr:hypothetical protein SCA04_18390 [Staphylococcus carnosus]GEP79037.1 hypothetical protein SCA05_08300 [Staphylococcus carnosus]
MNFDGLLSGLSVLIGVIISSFIVDRSTKTTPTNIVVRVISASIITIILFVSLMLIFHRF